MRTIKRKAVLELLWPLLLAVLSEAVVLMSPARSSAEVGRPVLLDFYSDWCGPCQSMRPTVEALAQAGYMVQRVNIDENPSLAHQYGVTRIPCFVAIADGREVDRVVGAASYQRLKVMVNRRPARLDVLLKGRTKEPTPAWRYERPVGYRAAVVRIFSQDGANTRVIGSGTLVRWNGRLVVLTARHVIRDAKRIIVELCTRRTHWAKVVKVDAVWDCAVLELVGEPEGVEPAEIELGNNALQREGSRLESCGYGPDGRLACSNGLFLGYRRSTVTSAGPDDWMAISGHARGGDSGGPVFNQRGRLVGVLWGTDGKEVVCVQAGRIHALLDVAVPIRTVEQKPQRALAPPGQSECLPQLPLVPVPPQPSQSAAVGCEGSCKNTADYATRKPILPWRGGAEKRDSELQSQADALARALELERQARLARKVTPPPAAVPSPPRVETPAAEKFSPLIAGLSIIGAVVGGFVVYFAVASKN